MQRDTTPSALLALLTGLMPLSLLAQDSELCSFRMPVQDAFTIAGGRLVLTGQVESGSVRTGEIVRVPLTNGTVSRLVEGIEAFANLKQRAGVGEIVGIMVSEVEPKDVDAEGLLQGDCEQDDTEPAPNEPSETAPDEGERKQPGSDARPIPDTDE